MPLTEFQQLSEDSMKILVPALCDDIISSSQRYVEERGVPLVPILNKISALLMVRARAQVASNRRLDDVMRAHRQGSSTRAPAKCSLLSGDAIWLRSRPTSSALPKICR